MKIWLFSDTHSRHGSLNVPSDVDMAICAGDMGTVKHPAMNANVILDSLEWYASLTHIRHKILIAGNHCTSIEAGLVKRSDIPSGLTYLQHESCEIEGLKIFGSPYTPSFGTGWAFNVSRNKIDQYWKDIPNDTDILVTHGPPKGILDLTEMGTNHFEQCGCKSLLNRIKEVQPLLHVFGHIHPENNCPNAAMLQIRGCNTSFINAAVVNLDYEIDNNGFVVNIDENKNLTLIK